MSQTEAVVEGTLKADGTLELDRAPVLAAGRVTVVLRTVEAATPSLPGLTGVIDDIQRGQQTRKFLGRSVEEIEAGLREGEDEYEQKMRPTSPLGPTAGDS